MDGNGDLLVKAHRERPIRHPTPSLWKRRGEMCGWVIRNL